MRLKELEIQGFKSFPDKTKITIGEGITGVVGPNGSGKSNISDSFRWVLGETNSKLLPTRSPSAAATTAAVRASTLSTARTSV